jgi:hypothetical protein
MSRPECGQAPREAGLNGMDLRLPFANAEATTCSEMIVYAPRVLVTDRLRSYGAARRHLELSARHEQGLRKNNRAENSHQVVRDSAVAEVSRAPRQGGCVAVGRRVGALPGGAKCPLR